MSQCPPVLSSRFPGRPAIPSGELAGRRRRPRGARARRRRPHRRRLPVHRGMMIRGYRLTSGAGIDGLALGAEEPRVPGPGEVAIAVHAVSLSYRELLVARGTYVLPVKPDVVPVSDGAGEVVAVGPGVTGVRPGERVTAALFPLWPDGPLSAELLPPLGGTLDGLLTERAIVPASALVPIPSHLSYA